jgi:acid phosphatase/vanadium-dependent haloperoxidase related
VKRNKRKDNTMIDIILRYKYIIVPFVTWFGIQLFKVLYKRVHEGVWDIERILGAGGMPSSHSAIAVSLATMIGKNVGWDTPIFALSVIFSLVVMYDAAGVRRAVGKQARILNDILNNQKLSNAEKLQEMTGHTPIQVAAGALIGIIVGLCF